MQNTNPGSERRKFKRLKAAFILTYQVNKPISLRVIVGWDREIVALMLDLSQDGIAISTDYDIPISTIIAMKFTLINLALDGEERMRSMKIIGEVKSNVLLAKFEHRLGIYFTQISEEDKTAIANFVKSASMQDNLGQKNWNY